MTSAIEQAFGGLEAFKTAFVAEGFDQAAFEPGLGASSLVFST